MIKNAVLQKVDIYSDYRNYLQSIKKAMQNFKSKPVKEGKGGLVLAFSKFVIFYRRKQLKVCS